MWGSVGFGGGNTDIRIRPIRNWDEGGIPKEIRGVCGSVGKCGVCSEGGTRVLLAPFAGGPWQAFVLRGDGPTPPPMGPPLLLWACLASPSDPLGMAFRLPLPFECISLHYSFRWPVVGTEVMMPKT